MKKSQHKIFVPSSLTLAFATLFLFASAQAQAKPRDTAFIYAGICKGEFDGVTTRIKLFVDPEMFCAKQEGSFNAMLLSDDPKSDSNMDLDLMSAQVSQVGDELQFSSEIGSDDGKSTHQSVLTMPAMTPSKEMKGAYKSTLTIPGEAPSTIQAEVSCDLIGYTMDCDSQ